MFIIDFYKQYEYIARYLWQLTDIVGCTALYALVKYFLLQGMKSTLFSYL